ncbi:hypothetical protein HF086_002811 [Spodoptera exigua]|uniref:Uncharacterized protein n=1 Tax=Spodoptera exigua TaxID=7107 RepID=A0A922MJD0_SPOEX|nr:hypothetical protein HF086_002811 [Spodoptera exigua]
MSSTSNSRRPPMETAGRPSKSLREKVLKNTAKTSSSVSKRLTRTAELPKVPKAASEPDVTGCETATQHSDATASVFETPTQELCRVSDIVINWEQCGVSPPHQIVSDDDSSVASSVGGADRPERKNLLYRTPRRGTGVEMEIQSREGALSTRARARASREGSLTRSDGSKIQASCPSCARTSSKQRKRQKGSGNGLAMRPSMP